MTLTTEQVQAILDRLEAGGTMKEEAAQLGMSYNVLRTMLEEVAGLNAYLTAMAEQRVKRATLPPSRNFLAEPVEAAKPTP